MTLMTTTLKSKTSMMKNLQMVHHILTKDQYEVIDNLMDTVGITEN